MCDVSPGGDPPHVRLILCPHGTYHLTVGMATLRLRETELAFVARAILAMARSHPSLHAQVAADDDAPDVKIPDAPPPPPPGPTE